MSRNKFGKYTLLGALAGAVVSMFDRRTREQLIRRSKDVASDIGFYSKNPDILKVKVQEKTDKLQAIYEQFSGDALYFKEKVDELKLLSPQVKEFVVDTKDAFTEAKDEYKSIADDNSMGEALGK